MSADPLQLVKALTLALIVLFGLLTGMRRIFAAAARPVAGRWPERLIGGILGAGFSLLTAPFRILGRLLRLRFLRGRRLLRVRPANLVDAAPQARDPWNDRDLFFPTRRRSR